jgi:3-hydroxyacyl-CoA dehydrogenase/enoyl-CoA hydratase/3-hydroxybutyryl-CoA epimerase
MKNFTLDIDADGLAVFLWDMPRKSMNVIDASVMQDLETILEKLASDAAIKGAVIASGKNAFSGGADLSMLAGFANASTASPDDEKRRIRDAIGRLGGIYRKFETCGKPLAAAIHGVCLGGAFELTLACHHRVAAEGAKVGLPESKVGLLPGAGGTQRVPRLIGAQEALKMMLRGTQIDAAEALRLGLVHRVVPQDRMVAAAKEWLKTGQPVQPWDERGVKIPGGAPYSPQGMPMWAAANALYRKETFDNYDAQRAILSCVYEGLTAKTIDTGLAIEITYFTKLLLGPQARVMIRSLFQSQQALSKGARRPPSEPETKIKTLGIVGAGFMGSGIAHVSARAGIDVVLIDRDAALAEKGKAHSAKLLESEIAKGRATLAERDAVLARIKTSEDFDALAPCDLVIEAVFEDRAVKAETWAKIDAALPPSALRASNTSTLPITSLAGYVKDGSRFAGIHFFSPVEKMQLVEIIKGKKTSDAALARALDYVRQIRKTPIVVNDSRGFFTSRVVTAHIAEAHHMLEEGVPLVLIENAGRMAGMPVGPLALADEIALDLQWRIMQATKRDLGEAYRDGPIDRILAEMVVKRERFGRKNGKGYYDYPPGAKKKLWPGIAEVVALKGPEAFDFASLKERLLMIQALETARCFEENVLTDPREADVGAILGFGFAPFTGGPLSWIDTMGADVFVKKCKTYAKSLGARFQPTRQLIKMAKSGTHFYANAA